jgi:hypothetical protein
MEACGWSGQGMHGLAPPDTFPDVPLHISPMSAAQLWPWDPLAYPGAAVGGRRYVQSQLAECSALRFRERLHNLLLSSNPDGLLA